MKRVILFLATNLAVVLVLTIVLNVLGVGRTVGPGGLNVGALAVFSLVVGFTGSIISLLMSKPMAKWSTGARVIEQPGNGTEASTHDVLFTAGPQDEAHGLLGLLHAAP